VLADRFESPTAADTAQGNSARRQIVLCADDYGISPGVNAAIRELIARGRLNATSVMVTAPSFHRSEALSLANLNSAGARAAIGLHVTLTAPFKPLSRDFGPLNDGAFPSLGALFVCGLRRGFKHDVLVAEIATQLRMFMHTFGRPPDFVDGHQHVHLFPQIRDAVLQVVKDIAPSAWVRQCGRVVPWSERFGDRKALLLDVLSRGFRRRAETLGVQINPAFAGTYDFRDEADFPAMFPRFLQHLPSGGVVMCHPGFVDAELRRLDPLTTLRQREYEFFAGDGFPALLARHGLRLA
jgi:predicted glycoside hydrolase/deacetylase ChbG (UPF0249 family)